MGIILEKLREKIATNKTIDGKQFYETGPFMSDTSRQQKGSLIKSGPSPGGQNVSKWTKPSQEKSSLSWVVIYLFVLVI